jgi:hypothetical protein
LITETKQSPSVRKKNIDDERTRVSSKEEIIRDRIESIRIVRNEAEQIKELDQHLADTCHEIIDELSKILILVDEQIVLSDSLDDKNENILDPKGILLQKNSDGEISPIQLYKLNPLHLLSFLEEFIPKLRIVLNNKKRSKESLSENLVQILDSFR